MRELKSLWKTAAKSIYLLAAYSLLELLAALAIGVLLSILLTGNEVFGYTISAATITLIAASFIIRTVAFYYINQRILEFSFEQTKNIIAATYEEATRLSYSTRVDQARFLKNINHEALNYQANAVTPMLFIISDSLAALAMLGASSYFSLVVTVYSLCGFMVVGGMWFFLSRPMKRMAELRSRFEARKQEVALSALRGRFFISASEIGDNIRRDFITALTGSARYGAAHQSLTQLPRMILELMLVLTVAVTIFFQLAPDANDAMALAMILKVIPNCLRILTNTGNLRSGLHSKTALEDKSFLLGGPIETLKVKFASDGRIAILPSSGRYKKNLILEPGINIITGESGIGKSVLLKSLSQCLMTNDISVVYLDRESIGDSNLSGYFIEHLRNDQANDYSESLREDLEEIAACWDATGVISSGQSERLVLLYAASLQSSVLIIDELFLNIPFEKKMEYSDLIELRRGNAITVIISHDSQLLRRYEGSRTVL